MATRSPPGPGGPSAEFWQARGTAHTLVPVPASLTEQRLAGEDNAIGLHSLAGRLGSDSNAFVLGIEDIGVASRRSDLDFNDGILFRSGVSEALS